MDTWVAWVTWVAWACKILWVACVGILAWLPWVHEIVLLKRDYYKFRKIYRKVSVLDSLVK